MGPARSFIKTVLVGLALAALAPPLHALAQSRPPRSQSPNDGWQVCNETSYIVETASATGPSNPLTVEGWTRIRPGECRQVLAAPLPQGPAYLHARSSDAHAGPPRHWGVGHYYCIAERGRFKQAQPRSTCEEARLTSAEFIAVTIDKRTLFTTRLTETENFGMARARAAGIQRLVADLGLDARRIDGYAGRRTSQAVQRFQREQRLPANATEAALIDAMEAEARRKQQNVGLLLCNRTPNRVWAAIARRRADDWESRGWWELPAGECARAINEPLLQTMYYVHGIMETDTGDRQLSQTTERFCVGATRFAIDGRGGCAARGYDDQGFVAAKPPQGRENIVFEFFERDFAAAPLSRSPTQ